MGYLSEAVWGGQSAKVLYDGDRFPVATELDRLEWADEQLL